MPADLVVDASGQGSLTEALLNSMGWPPPEVTSIGVDMGYATAFFDIPKNAPPEWMGVFTLPGYPRNKRGVFMLPVEDNRWILTILGRYDQKPPADWDDFRTAWGRAKMGAHSKHACLLGLFHSNIPP